MALLEILNCLQRWMKWHFVAGTKNTGRTSKHEGHRRALQTTKETLCRYTQVSNAILEVTSAPKSAVRFKRFRRYNLERFSYLVSWCFEPSQPQRITSGQNTNFTLSPSHSFHESSYHKSCFLSLFIFRWHSTREPASGTLTYFILRAYTGTMCSSSSSSSIP